MVGHLRKDTNDCRESGSIDITRKLLNNNFTVKVYDPMVKEKTIINDLQDIPNNKLNKLTVCSSAEKALKDSHAICILTEWMSL